MGKWKNPPSGKTRKRDSLRIDGQFATRSIEMLESPGYRVLDLTAHQVLARIEIELAHHAGYHNHDLPVTYAQFIAYGARRNKIPPAIRTLEALGIITVQYGRGGNAEQRRPSKFGLTYRYTRVRFDDSVPATDDWRRIKTIEEAREIVRRIKAGSNVDQKYRTRQRKTEPGLTSGTEIGLTSGTETEKFSVSPVVLQGRSHQGVHYLDSRGGGGGRGGKVSASSRQQPKLPWATPHLIEITDPEEMRHIRDDDEALLTDGDFTYG
jgi:hypothetical protein